MSSVSAGAEHSVAVTAAGVVYAWGWGRYGCLGNSAREDCWAPVQVPPLSLPFALGEMPPRMEAVKSGEAASEGARLGAITATVRFAPASLTVLAFFDAFQHACLAVLSFSLQTSFARDCALPWLLPKCLDRFHTAHRHNCRGCAVWEQGRIPFGRWLLKGGIITTCMNMPQPTRGPP